MMNSHIQVRRAIQVFEVSFRRRIASEMLTFSMREAA